MVIKAPKPSSKDVESNRKSHITKALQVHDESRGRRSYKDELFSSKHKKWEKYDTLKEKSGRSFWKDWGSA